jgi:hypothetical protein
LRLAVLQEIAVFGLVSLPQLALLHGVSHKTMSRITRPLFDAGRIAILSTPRALLAPPDVSLSPRLLFGSAPNIYQATKSGLALLAEHGLIEPGQYPRSPKGRAGMFLAHELFISDLRIFLLRSAAQHAGHQLETWHQGESAAMVLGLSANPATIRPDAWCVYRLGLNVLVIAWEADRHTERGDKRWDEKVAGYQSLFESGRLKTLTGYQNARVLTVTLSAARRDWIAEHIAKKARPEIAARFWVAERSVLETADLSAPMWRRPQERALVPLLPPSNLQNP